MKEWACAADLQAVIELLDQQLWRMKLDHRDVEALARVRAFVLSEFDEPRDEPWQAWFPLVASAYIFLGDGGQLSAALFGYVISSARAITGRPIPPGAPALPGPDTDLSWNHEHHVGAPPPIKRAGQPVVSPRCLEWQLPEYDVWQWDVMYDLITRRQKYLFELEGLDLAPLPGIDPAIVRDSGTRAPDLGGDPAFDFNVAVDSRPPMGLVVMSLLAREIAYTYGYEVSCGPICDWIFDVVTGRPMGPLSQPPQWLDARLEVRLRALEPAAWLAFLDHALDHLARVMAET